MKTSGIGGIGTPRKWADSGRTVLACRDCGVHVTDALARSEMIVPTRMEYPVGTKVFERELGGVEIPMAVCDACQARRRRAVAILDARPVLAHSLGSRSYGDEVIDCVLMVFEALGIDDHLDRAPIRELRLAMKNLGPIGSAAKWSDRFVPVLRLGVQPDTTAVGRWGHLEEAGMDALRAAYARFLRARSFSAALVEPPASEGVHAAMRGCLLCGVRAVRVTDRDAAPWGTMRSGQAATLGGRGRPEPLRGYLCPACSASMERHSATALGKNALEWAVFDYLNVTVKIGQADYFGRDRVTIGRGLQAWCVTGCEPSDKPWAHVDLESLRNSLPAA
ncbi:hypothetical protein GCM10028798_09840 [Humibacter antri]